MNIYSIPPLLAAIAYIPLLIILLLNRPWNSKQRLFIFFLVPAVLWSVSDVFLRSDFLVAYKELLSEIVLFAFALAAAQFHCFVSSYYPQNKRRWLPLAYASVAIVIFLSALDYVPKDFILTDGRIYPVFGTGILLVGTPLAILTVRNIYFLWRRFSMSDDPALRNQMVYLLLSIGVLTVSLMSTFAPRGNELPMGHIGNLIVACILTYAVLVHRLLDIRVVFRRGTAWAGLIITGVCIYVLLLFLIHWFADVRLEARILIPVTLAAIAVGVSVYLLYGFFSRIVDRFFYKESYSYRQKLHDFVKRELSDVFSLSELTEGLLPLLAGSLDCKHAYLLLPDPGSGDFIVEFSLPQPDGDLALMLKRDSPVLEWLKRENRYLSKENMEILPEFSGMWDEENELLETLGIELLFPLLSRDELIAVLALGKRKYGKYSLEDVNLVETVTSQVAASLEKEYLQEQLRHREQELSLVNRLTTVITSSLNIREVYDTFITGLREVVDVDWATIALLEEGELRLEVLATEVGSAWGAGDHMPLKGTGSEWVAKRKKTLVESDLKKRKRFWTGEEHLKRGLRSIVYLPLVVRDEVMGTLILASRKPNAYTPGQIRLLERLSSQIAVPVENSQLYARAEQRARVDELTSLFNRRHFDERIKQEIDRHARYRGMMSLVFLDLDFFKAYNDAQGHIAGDKILELTGKLISKSIRNSDLAFRYGGDEFAIILPHSAANDAIVVAERVRGRIAAEMNKRGVRISASLGLASWPNDGVTTDDLVNAADKALYYAKETGGNQTCMASNMLPSFAEKANNANNNKGTTEREVLSIIYNLAATIEARHPHTYGHSRKVSRYAVALAEAVGLPKEKVALISTAALIHDIGKVGIPDEVLNKAGKLEAEAWELVKSHPKLSATIAGHVVSLVACLPAILHHHERWDGDGYPDGLEGEAIPIEARILALADAFDAMTSSRPYRSDLSYKKVLQELKRCAGTQFDPKLVEAFLPIALSTAPEELGVGEDIGSSKKGS